MGFPAGYPRSTWSLILLLPALLPVAGCGGSGPADPAASEASAGSAIDSTLFTHHYVSRDLPGERGSGYGLVPPADFDGDGDLDYGVFSRGDSVYWFEQRAMDDWRRHGVGATPMGNLGGAVLDVDGDGHVDVLQGGHWFRNPGNPRTSAFEHYVYDDRIQSEIHDLVPADVNGDGETDLVALGDGEGCFWYDIPSDPAGGGNWPRTTITSSVLDENQDIHSGFFPGGIGDLDGDGDADLALADRWLENGGEGRSWSRHLLHVGARGPWGLSARTWIEDLDGDGDADVITLESDGTGSGGAWLENDGEPTPSFTVHELPTTRRGTRGSFHSLDVGDFDGDGDSDIFTAEQEDAEILPQDATPRWFVWENDGGSPPSFTERVIFDGRLGGHDALAADLDGDGDLDVASKIWSPWSENANDGTEHVDVLENRLQ